MRFCDTTFGSLLKPLDRRQFRRFVDECGADAYDKSFRSWDHLVALIYAQLSHSESLRALVEGFNANPQAHYHLGTGKVLRSTLSDANARRPVAVFGRTFGLLSQEADRITRREGAQMIRLIDASPIPLGKLCECRTWNGRIRGMKMHAVYDPDGGIVHEIEITSATVNDIEVGSQAGIAAGFTYVFDKGYCSLAWWDKIDHTGAFFITRAKTNMRLGLVRKRRLGQRTGDGFTVLCDEEVKLEGKNRSRLAIPLRRITIARDNGKILALLTNDMSRPALAIAQLYKTRWQIELLFRWIKQHLNIRKFLGRNENAIRLQILAAMIAYLLLRIAARFHRVALLPLRLAQFLRQFLFSRRPIAKIDKPPPIHASRAKPRPSNQLEFSYA